MIGEKDKDEVNGDKDKVKRDKDKVNGHKDIEVIGDTGKEKRRESKAQVTEIKTRETEIKTKLMGKRLT